MQIQTSHSNVSTIVLHIQDNCTEERSEDYGTKVAIEAAEVPVINPANRTPTQRLMQPHLLR